MVVDISLDNNQKDMDFGVDHRPYDQFMELLLMNVFEMHNYFNPFYHC